jgi:cardiolipin synthase
LIAALNVAAMRGVEVDIILPEANNLALVKWASDAMLWQVLERGCRVWMSPPPFEHTKLMLVDQAWILFGSGNWDPRSLRLNFEFDVECYDTELADYLYRLMVEKRKRDARVGEVIGGRGWPVGHGWRIQKYQSARRKRGSQSRLLLRIQRAIGRGRL